MSEHIYEDSDMEHERYHIIPFGSMREEIVRCRDCINYEPNDYIHFTCKYLQCWAKPDDYCTWGERIEQ